MVIGVYPTQMQFQFHKGTIRTDFTTAEGIYAANFNSIKVRLELDLIYIEDNNANEFQFHKGTIRTAYYSDKPHTYHNFNSIKVRLER